MDVDGIQRKLITNYRFQVFTFIVLGIIYARGAWNTFGVLFLAADAGHQCDYDGDTSPPVKTVPQTQKPPIILNTSLGNASYGSEGWSDRHSSIIALKQCSVIVQGANGTNISVPCDDWKFGTKFESTIVSEWKLVCVRAYLTELSTTLYMVGSMMGALFISPLSDRFGRRFTLLICLLIQTILGSCVALSPSYAVFTTLRFFVGFFNLGIALCTYVMMTETFPANCRTISCLGFQTFWAIGVMLTALFGYLVRDWRHLQLVFSLPNIVCLVFVWILPESLPWLIERKQLKKAQAVVAKIAWFNSLDCPNDLLLYQDRAPFNSQNPDNSMPSAHFVCDQPLLSGTLSHQNAVALLSQSSTCAEPNQGRPEDSNGSSGRLPAAVQAGAAPSALNGEMSSANVDPEIQIAPEPYSSNRRSGSRGSNQNPKSGEHRELTSVLVLFKSPRIRRYSIIMFYLFFVNSLGYFGISLSTPTLHGNQFFNLFLLGAVEIPAYIICVLVCERIGRKVPLCVFLLMCGVMNITGMLISEEASSGMSTVRVCFVILGKFAITGSYSAVYLYSAEIFPTALRNHAVGLSSFFENFGSIAAPFIVYFAKSHPELPMVLFGIISVTGGLTVLALPETNHRPLPQTIEEVESWGIVKRRSTQ